MNEVTEIPLLNRWLMMRRAVGKWLVVLTGLAVAQGVTALALIILARRISPDEYGQYLSSFSLLSLLVILPNFGLDAWLLARSRSAIPALGDFWPGMVRLRIQLLAIWLLGAAGLALILPHDAFPVGVWLLTALGLIGDSLSLLSYSALRNLGLHNRVTVMQIASSVVLLSATLILPIASTGMLLFVIARTIISIGAAVVSVLSVADLRRLPQNWRARDILHAARPFLSADLATSIYMKADLSIVALFLGATGAGLYGPALNLINVTFMVPNALYFLVVPKLSNAALHDRRQFHQLGRAQLIVQVGTGVVISLAMFILAQPIINLVYGTAYSQSATILRLLSPIPFLKSINFGLGALLTSGNRQHQRAGVQVLAAMFDIGVDLALIGSYGVPGVAVVYACSELFLSTGYAISVHRLRHEKSPQGAAG